MKESIECLDARNEVVHAYSNHEKVQSYFGHLIGNVSLKEGISRMVSDVKLKDPRAGEKFFNIEIEKRMPAAWQKLI